MLSLHHMHPEVLLFNGSSQRECWGTVCLAAGAFIRVGLPFLTAWPLHRGCGEHNFTTSERHRNAIPCLLFF